jgi:predicted Zn-dependent protease
VVDFQRRARDGAEQVRVFVLVEGKHLYRLICVAPASQFSKYAPVFQVVCGSFTPLDSPT